MKTISVMKRKSVLRDANVISSHVLYESSIQEDVNLKLKVRIVPHGNKDSDILIMRSD